MSLADLEFLQNFVGDLCDLYEDSIFINGSRVGKIIERRDYSYGCDYKVLWDGGEIEKDAENVKVIFLPKSIQAVLEREIFSKLEVE